MMRIISDSFWGHIIERQQWKVASWQITAEKIKNVQLILWKSMSRGAKHCDRRSICFSLWHEADLCWAHSNVKVSSSRKWAWRLCVEAEEEKPLKTPARLSSLLWACLWSLNLTLLKCSAWHYWMGRGWELKRGARAPQIYYAELKWITRCWFYSWCRSSGAHWVWLLIQLWDFK